MHNLGAGKKSSKENLCTQANVKVMFHTITSLGVASDLSELYFKLITFCIQCVKACIRSGIFSFNNNYGLARTFFLLGIE